MPTDETITRYQRLVEGSADVITILDPDGVIRYQSPAVERTLGYEPEALVGTSAFELIHPADRERAWAAIETLATEPTITERVEHRFEDATGEWVWLESAATTHPEDEESALVVVSRVIEDRKRAEEALAAEREKYRTLVERSHDAIAIVQDERIVFTNERGPELTGYDRATLLGMPLADLVAPEDREMVVDRYERRVDPDRPDPPARYTARFRRADGSQRVAEVAAARIDYEGNPADLLSIRDVTEREETARQLRHRTDELEAINRLVRHDIRNDMGIVLGWAQTLHDHVDEEGRQYLEKILASGEHVVELTEVVRDFVETIVGADSGELTAIDLSRILETELDLRRESFPDATIRLVGAVPDVDVRANELLSSVFRNLINNAVQHHDREHPTVEVACEREGDVVRVTIADDGPGIPDAQKESVFGKGEKGLDSPGTGIGLYLVRTLVENFDGRVWIADNDPRGTVVTVELPTADAEPPDS